MISRVQIRCHGKKANRTLATLCFFNKRVNMYQYGCFDPLINTTLHCKKAAARTENNLFSEEI